MQKRRQRKQSGTIIERCEKWYLRFYERQNIGGMIVRKKVTRCLGNKDTRGKNPPELIIKEAERVMNSVNGCEVPAEQIVALAYFIESVFLPTIERRLKGSSFKNYTTDWEKRLKPLVSRDRKNVKDYRTVDVQRWMDFVADGSLSRNSLKGFKAFLSSAFKEAKRLGYSDHNPVQDVRVPDAREPEDTYAYSLEEIAEILSKLPEPAATIFAVASYAGLRRGELEGLRWEDYRYGELHVERSIWNGETVEPKTAKSKAAVPVIRQLAQRLQMHRLRCGDPSEGWVFPTSNGNPCSLHNIVNRTIKLLFPDFHGFHAARRGLGSNLNRLGIDDSVIQRILRHSNLSTTQTYYIKTARPDVTAAMQKFQDTIGTPTVDSVRAPELVN